jgi:hypothetical protein
MSAMPRHAARLRREAQLLRPREALDDICCGRESVQRAAGMAAGVKHLIAPGPGESATVRADVTPGRRTDVARTILSSRDGRLASTRLPARRENVGTLPDVCYAADAAIPKVVTAFDHR